MSAVRQRRISESRFFDLTLFRSRLLWAFAKIHGERDECTSKAHSRTDQMHDVHRANGRETRPAEHAEKAQETEDGENESDAMIPVLIAHQIFLSSVEPRSLGPAD